MADARSVGLLGIGTALPPTIRTNDHWAGLASKRDDAQRAGDVLAIERSADGQSSEMPPEIATAMREMDDDLFRGAKLRHVLAPGELISDFESAAVDAALRDAALSPDDIDVVMVASLMPDRMIPSNAPAVQAKSRLRRASAWSVDVGCASFQAQLVAASALVQSGVARHVAIVQSSAATRFVEELTPPAIGFGDGAAAAIVGAVPAGHGLISHYLRTDGTLRDGIVLAPIVNGCPQEDWWTRREASARMATFDTQMGKLAGLRAPDFVREACSGALARAEKTIDDVALYVGNQSVGWFVRACCLAIGIPRERAVDTFAEVANIGSAAILFNLDRARREGRLRSGDWVLMYSPSAGFTLSAVVYRWMAPEEIRA